MQARICTDGLRRLARGCNRILALTRKAPHISLPISHPRKGQKLGARSGLQAILQAARRGAGLSAVELASSAGYSADAIAAMNSRTFAAAASTLTISRPTSPARRA